MNLYGTVFEGAVASVIMHQTFKKQSQQGSDLLKVTVFFKFIALCKFALVLILVLCSDDDDDGMDDDDQDVRKARIKPKVMIYTVHYMSIHCYVYNLV